MSKKTLADVVITKDTILTTDKFRELLQKTYVIACREFSNKLSIPDGCVLTHNNPVPIQKDSTIELETGGYIPKQFANDDKALNKIFQVVNIDGVYYDRVDERVVRTVDDKYALRENTYQTVYGDYYVSDEGLIYLEHEEAYIQEDNAVFVEDLQRYEIRDRTTSYINEDNETLFYRYREMRPGMNSPFNFNETKFPENITDRRVGVEFEFGQTTKLCKSVLGDEKLRSVWQSTRDGSLDNIPNGKEFVSIPIRLNDLNLIEEFLTLAKKDKAMIHKSCGYHIHVGAEDFNFMDTTALIALCSSIEDEMFSLMPEHRQQNRFCKKMDERFNGFLEVETRKDKKKAGTKLYENMRANFETRHENSKYVDAENQRGPRYYWINIDRFYHKREQPEQKTVEFRHHHATFDARGFTDFAYLCYYITLFAKRHCKETCAKASLVDVVKYAKPSHRKRLSAYLKKYKNMRKGKTETKLETQPRYEIVDLDALENI